MNPVLRWQHLDHKQSFQNKQGVQNDEKRLSLATHRYCDVGFVSCAGWCAPKPAEKKRKRKTGRNCIPNLSSGSVGSVLSRRGHC